MIFYLKDIPPHIKKLDAKVILANDIKPATEIIKAITDELIDEIWLLINLGISNNGIGFAATQAGIQKKMFVMESTDYCNNPVDHEPFWIPYIHPSFYLQNKEQDFQIEGCLSVPDQEIKVLRFKNIVAQWQSIVKSPSTEKLELKHQTKKLSGENARCYQHEKDHLSAISILNYLPSIKS